MKTATLISLDRPRRLLDKVRHYISDSALFFSDPSAAVTIFLDALPHADPPLILKMVPLLGCAGDERVLWPLFYLITSRRLDYTLRSSAAIHLALAASMSQNPFAIRKALVNNLKHPDADIRSTCALSLGWKGNGPAVEPLAAQLSDPEQEVRAAVIAALSSIEDQKILNLLEERLNHGAREERRVIFLHLWRFRRHIKQVEDIYIRHMAEADTDLRLDMLAGLAMLPLSPRLIDLYQLFMADKNARIRHQILENLSSVEPFEYRALTQPLRTLLADEDARVRQAAVKLFSRIQ